MGRGSTITYLLGGKKRASFIGMVVAMVIALLLLVLSAAEHPVVTRARTTIAEGSSPIYVVINMPLNFIEESISNVAGLFTVYQENAQLRAERDALLQWQSHANELAVENEALRTLLALETDQSEPIVTARVLAQKGGPYVASIIVAAGELNGVRKHQAAVAPEGLVGRVIQVGKHQSWVLLLDDINSRIPVIGEQSRVKAILAGDGRGAMELHYVSAELPMQEGERVVTASDGDALPYGIPVGVVMRGEDAVILHPYVHIAHLDYVQLVDRKRSPRISANTSTMEMLP